jgi:hypothetical protein
VLTAGVPRLRASGCIPGALDLFDVLTATDRTATIFDVATSCHYRRRWVPDPPSTVGTRSTGDGGYQIHRRRSVPDPPGAPVICSRDTPVLERWWAAGLSGAPERPTLVTSNAALSLQTTQGVFIEGDPLVPVILMEPVPSEPGCDTTSPRIDLNR